MKTSVSSIKSNQQLLVRSLVIGLAAAMPLLVHLAPPIMGVAAGAVLLPMFYLPLVATAWRLKSLMMLALFLPWLNMWITGMPGPLTSFILTLEVGIFMLSAWNHDLFSLPQWLIGPAGYLVAKAASAMLLAFFVLTGIQQADPLSFAMGALTKSWPGLLILMLFSTGLFRNR